MLMSRKSSGEAEQLERKIFEPKQFRVVVTAGQGENYSRISRQREVLQKIKH